MAFRLWSTPPITINSLSSTNQPQGDMPEPAAKQDRQDSPWRSSKDRTFKPKPLEVDVTDGPIYFDDIDFGLAPLPTSTKDNSTIGRPDEYLETAINDVRAYTRTAVSKQRASAYEVDMPRQQVKSESEEDSRRAVQRLVDLGLLVDITESRRDTRQTASTQSGASSRNQPQRKLGPSRPLHFGESADEEEGQEPNEGDTELADPMLASEAGGLRII